MALTGYRVIRAEDIGRLEREVLAAAGEGYVPYGSVTEKSGTLYQTMVMGDIAGGAAPTSELDASAVNVEAGTDGLAAGTVQQALQALATRIAVVEGGG